MYDETVKQEYRSTLQPSIEYPLNSGNFIPFELTDQPLEYRKQFIDYANNLIDFELYQATCDKHKDKVQINFKNPNYQWSVDELIWMENEKLICKWDYDYWAAANYKILDHEGKWIHYVPNLSQRINNRIFARLQKAKRAIKKLTLKARQGGETTDSQGRILQRMNYFVDTGAVIASKDSPSTDDMSKKFTLALNQFPYWNRMFLTRYETGDFYEFDTGGILALNYGTQKSIGRGKTTILAHLSEVPFFKYPHEAIEEALFKGMHESIWQIQILEGTAEVRGDWYHKFWLDTVKGMDRGTTAFVGVFHPWFYRTDIYPTETWMNARSTYYANWMPSTETLQLAKKAEQWVKTNPDARAELGSNYKIPIEQLFYYELEKEYAESKNKLHKFLKEMPTTPDEAFQHAGHTLYPIKIVTAMSTEAQLKIPEVYKLRGDPNEISPVFFPTEDEIYDGTEGAKVIKIRAHWDESLPPFDYELIQVKFEGWDRFDPVGKILIWEHPKSNAIYGAATDTSDGLGRDISDDAVHEIFKKGTIAYRDKQVCEFASPELPMSQFWPYVLALNTLYSPVEQLLYAPEINYGRELLTAMVNRGWYNFFNRSESGEFDLNDLGFMTTNRTRPYVIEAMNGFIIGKWFEIFSIPLIDEIKDIEKKRGLTSTLGFQKDKILGNLDNRFMATGICIYALHKDEFIGMQQKSWETRVLNENSRTELAVYTGENYYVDRGLGEYYNQINTEDEDNLVGIVEEY